MQNICTAGGWLFPICLGERKRIILEYKILHTQKKIIIYGGKKKKKEKKNRSQLVLVVITPSFFYISDNW